MSLVRLRASGSAWSAWLPWLALLQLSCEESARPSAVLGDFAPTPGASHCARPLEGCSCQSEQPVPCSYLESRDDTDAICAEGQRSCNDGVWSACQAQRRVKKYAPRVPAGVGLAALAPNAVSCEDPCQPDCSVFRDSSQGVPTPPGLVGEAGGLTLTSRADVDACTDLRIRASDDTITVTSIDPLATEPLFIYFTATCGSNGQPVSPTWAIDAAPRTATMDQNGTLILMAPVAGDIEVRAINRRTTSRFNVSVRVLAEDIDPACASVAEGFAAASGLLDPGRTLYPYSIPERPVVFPLGLSGPLVQWANGGVASSCVKVGLRYPRGSAAPVFSYAKYVSGEPLQGLAAGNEQPALQIPNSVWNVFDRSARGGDAEIFVQRRSDEADPRVFDEMKIPVRFATEPLQANLFYSQYVRRFRRDPGASTAICAGSRQTELDPESYPKTSRASGCLSADCDAEVGPVCPAGNCTQPKNTPDVATLQRLDLTKPGAEPEDPFQGRATCTVCHSISADGRTFAAANRKFAGGATLARIGEDSFEPFAAPPTYSYRSTDDEDTAPENEQSRGFSFGALSPDASYVLQSPNFWGNTEARIGLEQGTNLQDAAYPAGGKRAFLLDVRKLRPPVQYATTGPLPDHTATPEALLGDEAEALSIDGGFVVRGEMVLVKDAADASENGVYVVEESGAFNAPWRLRRRADADGSGDLEFGQKFHVEAGNSQRNRTFYLAAPSAGGIQPGLTPLRFALYTTVGAATSQALPAYSESGLDLLGSGPLPASAIDGVEPALGLSVLVKDEAGANAHNNGVFRISSLEPWVLTRRSDSNSSSELHDAFRVRVNQGVLNGGRAYTLRSAGPVELGEDALLFAEDASLNEGLVLEGSALPTLMYPTFSPDGRHLAYVNGAADGLGTGWRRGLTILDFDANSASFSNPRLVLNRYVPGSPGNIIKWPTFEPDSRSLVFVESTPDEFCPLEAYQGKCQSTLASASGREACAAATETLHVDSDLERACYQEPSALGYGSASPMARGYWPGRLHSINLDSGSGSVGELVYLNRGQLPADADKAYQPSVLPAAAGGYRWVVFSSHRSYGNQFNQVGTHFSCGSSTLWMAALDDSPAQGADRSYPAFLVPGQRLAAVESPSENHHYLNERGVLAPAVCRESGSQCTSDSECCGGDGPTPTSACRPDYPETFRLESFCQPLAEACRVPGESCGTNRTCCAGLSCQAGTCLSAQFHDRTVFQREFVAECPNGYKPRWLDFTWHASAASDSRILFSAQVSQEGDFDGATLVSLGRTDASNSNPPPAEVRSAAVGAALLEAEISSGGHLRVRMEFVPSSDGRVAPTLQDWTQSYDCVALE